MKVKTTCFIVALVLLLVSFVILAFGGLLSFSLQGKKIVTPSLTPEPTQTHTAPSPTTQSPTMFPTPSASIEQTPQLSASAVPTNSPLQTQTPQIPPSPTPTQIPAPSPTPLTVATYIDVSYGADPAQKFDIYVPNTSAVAPLPLIIFVHGGAWIAGDKADMSPIASFLAKQDYVIINMNYRLLPFSYPAPMEDIQLVLKWVHGNSEQYGIDVARIGMSGHSAGGHLVALYALTQDKNYTVEGSSLPRVYAIAPLAGGYTLAGINITSQRRNDTIMEWLSTANPQCLGLPIDQIDSGDNVTFILLHGSLDVNSPPSQAVLFYQALVAKGVPTEIRIYPGRTHLTLVSGIPNNDEVARDLVSFFDSKLK